MGLGPTRGMNVAVILTLSGAKGKDLQFRSDENQCRFFAALRMTGSNLFPACDAESACMV